MTQELWLPLKQFPKYEISDLGRIRWRSRIRKFTPDQNGYLRVSFWTQGKAIKVAVHILVAENFIGPRPAGSVVRHINGTRTDNRVTNFAYGTAIENEADKASHGTKIEGTKHHSNKLTESQVAEIRQRYIPRDKLNSLHAIGREYGISAKTVERIVKRRIWKHVP